MNEERSVSLNVNLGTVLGTVVYLTIGLFFYAVWYAPEAFTWNDPWIVIVAVLWPFAVMWEISLIVLYLAIIAAICFGIYIIYDRIRSKINGTKPTIVW